MTIHTDKRISQTEPHRERRENADHNQHSLVCRNTLLPGSLLFLQYAYGQLNELGRAVREMASELDAITLSVEKQHQRNNDQLTMLAACQRDTASALNHQLERPALHPAIEATAILAQELFRLKDQAEELHETGNVDEQVESHLQEVEVACCVAQQKLEHLDIRSIMPSSGCGFDPEEHCVCGYTDTDAPELHGRVSELVTGGVVYRGTVLRAAKVLVFRNKVSGDLSKERKDQ